MLRLNDRVYFICIKTINNIQIQPMLRLNTQAIQIIEDLEEIQIQPMLRLNDFGLLPRNSTLSHSNTTNVKVKCNYYSPKAKSVFAFKYNQC